jgi:opacity protein-like surface antigen
MRRDVRTYVAALLCVAALAGSAQAANAQTPGQAADPPPSPTTSKRIDFTPFVAMGDDLAPGGGAAFTFAWTRHLSVEAEASLGTDAARSSLSLLYALPAMGRFATYVAGGAGVQRDEFETYEFPRFVIRKTEFAVNIGAGVNIPVNDRFTYRADFRWYNPKAEWPESWRVYSGITFAIRGRD